MTNFNPTQYQYKSSNDYGEFSYYWAFCSYDIGDSYVKLVLNIDLEGYTEDDIANFKNYADYPKLAKILEDIVVDYEGQILTDNPASFGFAFEHKKDMFDFISDVAKRMNVNGIGPFNGIDRCSAFPSAEYATDMFTYLFNEDCSILEVEEHMAKAAGVPKNFYEEVCGFTQLPVKSEQKFDVLKNTDVSDFLNKWAEYLHKFNESHKESCMPTKLCCDLKKMQRTNKPEIPTTEEVSKDYSNFSSMWY